MKKQIVMSPLNGEIGVATPLYMMDYEEISNTPIYKVLTSNVDMKPLAFIIDDGSAMNAVAAGWLYKNLVVLGDL